MSTGNTQQAGAGQHQQYSDRQEQISASNRTTGSSRLAPAIQQPPGTGLLRRPPSVRRKKNRLSLTLPIQQHTGIYQYTTPYHSAEQRRARKGGARGESGLRNSERLSTSQTCPRQSVPPKGKELHCPKCPPPGKKLSVRRHRLSAQERPSDARHCTISGTIFSLFLSIIQLHVYYKEHTSKLLTLNSESVILWSS